jgi:hypothetical protein
MVPEDLLFWIAPISEAPISDPSLLCERHADAMIVPRGWTLDDRREAVPRLFNTRQITRDPAPLSKPKRHRPPVDVSIRGEQMQIDGTGEIERPAIDAPGVVAGAAEVGAVVDGEIPDHWQPEFDVDDDLDGLLQVSSPLLARAFRGTDRPKH